MTALHDFKGGFLHVLEEDGVSLVPPFVTYQYQNFWGP